MALVVFDELSTWEAALIEALGDHFSSRLAALRQPHEYVEDSRDTLLADDRRTLLSMTLAWIGQNSIAAYHGTRLNSDELRSVCESGLTVLDSASRIVRLQRALSVHPNWRSVAAQLEGAVGRGGRGVEIGNRSGQAHLTLSRAGLTNGFNHYLSHGSEFDRHIAHQLLGEEGVSLLEQDGTGYILEFSVPGPAAITAAHPYFTAEDMIERGEVPNIANEFLKVLSYRVYDPEFHPAQRRTDCGLVFSKDVPASWLHSVVAWPEGEA
jgi:hypothetical protein